MKITAAFRTPEEAQAFLKEVQTLKKKQEKPTPPTNLNSSDLNDWYSQQRQFELQERKKRIEAETLLRGYRGSKLDIHSFASQSSKSGSGAVHVHFPSEPKKKSNGIGNGNGNGNGIVFEGSIVVKEGIDHVLDQVDKLEREVNSLTVDGDDDDENEHPGDGVEEELELENGAYISASSDEGMIGEEQELSPVEKDISEVEEGDKDESEATVEEMPEEEVEVVDDSAEDAIIEEDDKDSTEVETEEPVADDDAVAETEEIVNVEEEAVATEEETIEEDAKSTDSDQEPVEEPADEEEIQEDSSVADAEEIQEDSPVAADAIQKDYTCSEEEKKNDERDTEGNATAALNPEASKDGWRFLISRGKFQDIYMTCQVTAYLQT